MGAVYKAESTRLKRTVALKFLPRHLTQDAEAKIRFITEPQAASTLDHANICILGQIDETEDGQQHIIMAHDDGETQGEKFASAPVAGATYRRRWTSPPDLITSAQEAWGVQPLRWQEMTC